MSFSFTDIPLHVSLQSYQQAIERMLDRLKTIPGVVSVYQVGGVSTPGISDIDLFVVFQDKVKTEIDPVKDLQPTDQYLFTHNLFGTSESFVDEVEQYTCFGKYQLLFGKEQSFSKNNLDQQEDVIVKKQIALEYLVKAYISSVIEHSYHTIKLRNLFLHAKALLIDLSFLGIDSGKLNDAIKNVMNARSRWFEHRLSHANLNDLAHQYHSALREGLKELLMKEKFYLHPESNLQISRNILLKSSESLSVSQEGVLFPKSIVKLHHKIPKLLNRMNKFVFQFPAQQNSLPEVVAKRHQFISSMVKYQKSHLPNFIPTAYGLSIFNKSGE